MRQDSVSLLVGRPDMAALATPVVVDRGEVAPGQLTRRHSPTVRAREHRHLWRYPVTVADRFSWLALPTWPVVRSLLPVLHQDKENAADSEREVHRNVHD